MIIQKKYFWATAIVNILFYIVLFIARLVFKNGEVHPSLDIFRAIPWFFSLVALFFGFVLLILLTPKRYTIYGLLINLLSFFLASYLILSNLHGGYG